LRVSPDSLDASARLVWGGHWMERLGRKLRIRPRTFEAMINGREPIPPEVVEAVVNGLRMRASEIDAAVLELSGPAA
jgi:hypothetical protein